jgi:hypothetical protein
MIEGLFLNWVKGHTGNKTVKGNDGFSALVAPDAASAKHAALNQAIIGAKPATDISALFGRKQ